MLIEIVNITFLLWQGNYKSKNVKILIDPDLNENYIDENFLKKQLDTISETYCIDNSPYEIPIEFSIPNKVDSHSFYIKIIPNSDFPENLRKEGIILLLGKSWIEMTKYPLEK